MYERLCMHVCTYMCAYVVTYPFSSLYSMVCSECFVVSDLLFLSGSGCACGEGVYSRRGRPALPDARLSGPC